MPHRPGGFRELKKARAIAEKRMKTTITGNTYPVKEQLKALGGTWNRLAQGWDVPIDRADEARAIVATAGESSHQPRLKGRYRYDRGGISNVTRFSSGAIVYRNKQGRCEDAPCCGCCS